MDRELRPLSVHPSMSSWFTVTPRWSICSRWQWCYSLWGRMGCSAQWSVQYLGYQSIPRVHYVFHGSDRVPNDLSRKSAWGLTWMEQCLRKCIYIIYIYISNFSVVLSFTVESVSKLFEDAFTHWHVVKSKRVGWGKKALFSKVTCHPAQCYVSLINGCNGTTLLE